MGKTQGWRYMRGMQGDWGGGRLNGERQAHRCRPLFPPSISPLPPHRHTRTLPSSLTRWARASGWTQSRAWLSAGSGSACARCTATTTTAAAGRRDPPGRATRCCSEPRCASEGVLLDRGSGWVETPTWQSYQMLFRAQVCVGGYHLGQSYQIDAVQSPGECSSGEWGGDGRPI